MPSPNTCEVTIELSPDLDNSADQLVNERNVTFEDLVISARHIQLEVQRTVNEGEDVRMVHGDSPLSSARTFSPAQIEERIQRVRNLQDSSPPNTTRNCIFPAAFYNEVEVQALVEGTTPDKIIATALVTIIAAYQLVHENSEQ